MRNGPKLTTLAGEGYFFCRTCERVCYPEEHDYRGLLCNFCHSQNLKHCPAVFQDETTKAERLGKLTNDENANN